MATFYTEYQEVEHFFIFNSGPDDFHGPNFFFSDFDMGFALHDDYTSAQDARFLDTPVGGNQNATHRTGGWGAPEDPNGVVAIAGSTLAGPGTTLTINGIMLESEGTTLVVRGAYTLAEGSDNFSGTVNSITQTFGTPGTMGYELFEFTGALTTSTGSLTASRIHVERIVNDEGEPWEIIGTVTGTNIKFGDTNPNPEIDDEQFISGNVTGFSISIGGTVFEGSGFSVNAVDFFDAFLDPDGLDDETLFELMGGGADTITGGGGSGQILSGYAGNDVLIAGADNSFLVGGIGNDIFDFNGHTGIQVFEAEGAAGGIDTIRTNQTKAINDSNTIERLVLLGIDEINGTGNGLANVITGNAAFNVLDGLSAADTLIGGGGGDHFHLDNVLDKIGPEAADESVDSVYSSVSHSLGANLEELYLEEEATVGTGNGLDNYIGGTGGANTLSGAAGNDSINGQGGTDKIDGGEGADSIEGGAGANTILGGGGNDTIYGGDNVETDNDRIDGGAGDDSVDGGEGADSLAGGAGADSIYGGINDDTITGGDGNDLVYGGDGNDNIDGGGGNDTIYAGSLPSDVNTLKGGAGNDIFYTDLHNDSIDGGAGTDTLIVTVGEGAPFVLNATTENLTFTHATDGSTGTGNALANVFVSGDATDHFDGKGGNDTYNLNGGDTASEDSSGGGVDRVEFTGTSTTFILGNGIESLTLLGGGSILAAGNDIANVLTNATAGAVSIDGGIGNDTYNLVAGDMAGDSGGDTADLVNATLEDNDSFTLGGGIENLTLFHDPEGNITGIGNGLANRITGAANANNLLNGLGGADNLIGNAGADTLDGGNLDGAVDTMVGGAGNDVFVRYVEDIDGAFTLFADNMADSGGSDTVQFLFSGDLNPGDTYNFNLGTATGFSMIENLDASLSNPLLQFNFTGSTGNNMLVGGGGTDTLSGAGGNDWLDGGAGADSMIGGLGNDSYVLTILNGGGGNATVSLTEVNEAAGTTGGTGDVMVLTGGAGNSALFSHNIGADSLSPFEGVDASRASTNMLFNLTGNAAGNLLVGGLGADTAGNGHDTLIGGGGNDTYGANDGDMVDEVTNGGGGNADLVIAYLVDGQTWELGEGIENLTLVDISGDTTLNGTGNELANRITGDSQADNSLNGGVGTDDKDTLIGGAGNDTLEGGSGADSLVGGLGNDTYKISFGITSGAVAALPDAILDTGGIDTLLLQNGEGVILTHTLGATIENLDASALSASGAGTNKFSGNALANRIIGSTSNDSIAGGAGNDTLGGGHGEGVDTLDGGLGDDDYLEQTGSATYLISQAGDDVTAADTMTGGIDTVIISATGNTALLNITGTKSFLDNVTFTGTESVGIFGNSSANTLISGGGSDTIFGGDFDDNTTDGDDNLAGGAGNDWLDGSEGADTLTGGAGNDSLVGGYADKDGFGSTELGDSIKGDAGNDTLDGGEGGNDTLLGGDGNDSLWGGNDDHGAAPSDDSMKGDAGNDTLDGGNGNDVLDGGAGNDFLAGSQSGYDDADTLIGGDGADTLWGGNGADSMLGNAGNDVFDNASMAGGDDTMVGGTGDDTYFVNSGDDVITEFAGQGNDSVLSSASSYTLSGAIERLTITEYVVGGNGTGNATANTIVGNSYNNILAGGGGNDTVTGGDGSDQFNLAHTTAGNVMAIQDYDHLEGDKIGLDGNTDFGALFVGINMSPGAITNGTVASSAAGVAQLVYTYGSGITAGQLFYDANGSTAGGAVLIATFAGATKPIELTNSDFVGFNLA